MIDHDVVRLDVAVHDAFGVAKVESLEELKDIVAHIKVGEFRVQCFELGVLEYINKGPGIVDGTDVDEFGHDRWCLGLQGTSACTSGL